MQNVIFSVRFYFVRTQYNVMPWLNMAQASELAEYLTIDYMNVVGTSDPKRKNNNGWQPELYIKLKMDMNFVFYSSNLSIIM